MRFRLPDCGLLLLLGSSCFAHQAPRGDPPPPLSASTRAVLFGGRTWAIRASGEGQVPGPNDWSDREDAVWVDDGGLHLVLRRDGDRWRGVEMSTVLPPEAVHVQATVASPLSVLPAEAVFGLFVYRDDDHEADIELSRWGSPHIGTNGQFAVAPYGNDQKHRFQLDPAAGGSELVLDWRVDRVAFEARQSGRVLAEWRDTGERWRVRDGYRLHLNLWLYEGRPPADGKDVEVVLSELVVR